MADLVTIYVHLPDEAVDCWRPVQAVPQGADLFRIVSVNHDPDESWAFPSGQLVRCEAKRLSEGTVLVAVQAVEDRV